MDLLDRLRTALAGRYAVQSEIGRGGMAVVYLARDLRHNRDLAIKVLNPDLGASLSADRFLREVQIEAQLSHPYILPLFDSGETDGLLYYVMPYVAGESLRELLNRETQLPLDLSLRIAREVSEALAYAHALGVVHRDVKPGNILLDSSHAYLADFGIARAVSQVGGRRLSESGLVVGTPEYMSPEQCSEGGKIDGRSDIYALGCVLYEMLSGEPPFTGPTAQAVIARQMQEPPRSLRIVRSAVPDHVEEAIQIALEKVPADRFSTATQFISALAGGGETVSAVRRSRSARRRHLRTRLSLLGGLAGVLLLGLWRLALPDLQSRDPKGDGVAPSPLSNIAVLYFQDRSQSGRLEYLSAGLTEDLIDRLAAVKALRVISPDGVRPYRDRSLPLDSLARLFNVGTLVTGTISSAAGRVRASVRLTDATNRILLFSGSFEKPVGNLLELRDQLAEEVTRQLRIRLGEAVQLRDRRAGTGNAAAWDLVLRAEQIRGEALELPARESVGARSLFREADSLAARAEKWDPDWLEPGILRGWLAYDQADRAVSTGLPVHRSVTPIVRWINQGVEYADRALRKSPGAPEALELRGSLLYRGWALTGQLGSRDTTGQLERAERDLRAAASQPYRYQARALSTLSAVLQFLGKMEEANRAAQRAYHADAYLRDASRIVLRLFDTSLNLRRYDEAARWCEQGRRAYPGDWVFLMCRLSLMAWSPSVPPSAKAAWQIMAELDSATAPDVVSWVKPQMTMVAASVLARSGLSDSAERVIARAKLAGAGDPEMPYYEALARVRLGQSEKAAGLLVEVIRKTPNFLPSLRSALAFQSLWTDPRLDGFRN